MIAGLRAATAANSELLEAKARAWCVGQLLQESGFRV